MVMVFVSITVLALSIFIVQRLIQIDTSHVNLKSIYLAQAGIYQAVYNYRFQDLSGNGYFSTGRQDIDTNNYFVLGGTDADLLMVDNTATYLTPTPPAKKTYRYIEGWPIQNACNTRDIEIESVIVTWDNTSRLRQIAINGSNPFNGNLRSGEEADIRNFTLRGAPTPLSYPSSYLRFDEDMTGATIDVQFIMVDGSSRTVRLFPPSNNFDFTVKSTGKVSGSNLYRSIEANYNSKTSQITSYYEIDTEVTP